MDRIDHKGIDHIGLAVADLEAAKRAYVQGLGLRLILEEEVPEQKVRLLKVAAGDGVLELLESTDPEGPVGKFLERKGPGVHHIALKVADLRETLQMLKERGIRLIDETPRIGAGGKSIAFIHPKETGGILIELTEG